MIKSLPVHLIYLFTLCIVVQTDVYAINYSSNTDFISPVNIISFRAKALNLQVALDWQSAHEINVSHYIVERSGMELKFNQIKEIKAKDESSLIHNYLMTDVQPLLGTSYYRLKIVDKDGKFTYTKIITIQIGSNLTHKIALYPNPSDGKTLHFSVVPADMPVTVKLYDIIGNPVAYTITGNENGMITLQFDQALPPGMYVAVITNSINKEATFLKYTVK